MSSAPNTNHLVNEKSPYLLQHLHNPVDWYPWGKEAFELAQSEDKPIFLSIGYATCHWCHVMEKESFEDPEVAKLMNEVFVNIKVDREELPEIDTIYMEFAQALMSSAGGWPLNVILTPDLKPFFAITYLPPKSKRGLMGLQEFSGHIKQIWESEERARLLEQADKLVEMFQRASFSQGEELPSENHVLASLQVLFDIADPIYGGIKGAPKFPMSYQANFLLEISKAKGDSRALFYVELTLDMMHNGGIYDHLGGGFSRYSVDERWHVPHFEKMAYDNAILADAYLEAWRFTKKGAYKTVVEEILNYILRDMTHADGGFYSAEDADTDGQEGLFYTWTPTEIQEVLSLEEAELFCQLYGVSHEGNFEGRSVLHLSVPIEEFAEIKAIPLDQLLPMIAHAREALFKKRQQRSRPFKDDKILSSWNGLMIHAFIKASGALNEQKFREAAVKAAEFIKAHLWKNGKLLRRWREGESRFNAGLEDYSFMIKGLISLFEQGCGSEWLKWAIEMADILELDFKAEDGAFYHTDGNEPVLIRKCEFYDGAEPSGNGVHCENLIRLFQLTQSEKYLDQAEDILKAARKYIESYPPGACYHLLALQRYLDVKAPTIVIALDEMGTMEKEIAEVINSHFCPNAVVVWKKKEDEQLLSILPSVKDKMPIDGQTAVHICRQDMCLPPVIEKGEITKAIHAL
jgi:uncharacterized protein